MSKLWLVPTPIGNLEDITLRALRILKECDLVVAEDTRVSGHLLRHFGIEKKIISNHIHNEHRMVDQVIMKLQEGMNIALVTDAGTPGISDPGFLIVRECVRVGIPVECLPGPVAFIPALVQSGFPCNRFCFEGFLPQKKGRQKRLGELKTEERTIVFYESPYRLVKALTELISVFGGEREASVSRELTKIYAETKTGSLASLLEHFSNKTAKGEIVIVVKGFDEKEISSAEEEINIEVD
jgi:16S rRNA (cytidine1402-2'-O)-methyltransferase